MYSVIMVNKQTGVESDLGEYCYEVVEYMITGYSKKEFAFYDIYYLKKSKYYYRVQRIGVKEDWSDLV